MAFQILKLETIIMKKNLSVLLLLSCLFPSCLFARHIIGGSMDYYHTDSGQLMVELVVYCDCAANGATLDLPAQIAVYQQPGVLFTTLSINDYAYEKLALDNNACFSSTFCFEKGTYTFPLTLPQDGSSYTVVYQRCCRGNDITNLINPEDIGFTMSIEISPEARTLKNNSPRWTNNPGFNACIHEPFTLDLSAPEPDGDLLVYSFCNPAIGGGNITSVPDVFSCIGAIPTPPCAPPFELVQFAVPNYNFNNPLGALASQLNPTNGLWSATPDFVGKFSYAVCVQEYRDGVLLSTLQQDLTLWVEDVVRTTETSNFATITCFPNPAGNAILVSTETFEKQSILIELSDLSGKIWMTETRLNAHNQELINIDLLPAGIYLIKLSANGKTVTGKFIRQ